MIELATDTEVGFPGFTSVTARTAPIEDPKVGVAIGDFLNRLAKYLRWSADKPEETAKSYVKTQQLREREALFAAKSGALTLIPVNKAGEDFKAELVVTEKLSQIGFYPRPVDFRTVIDDGYNAQIEAGDAWREASKAN